MDVMDLPPYSPDLNPIENVWGQIDYCLDKEKIRTKDDFRKEIGSVWKKNTKEHSQILAANMNHRCELVIKEEGRAIDY